MRGRTRYVAAVLALAIGAAWWTMRAAPPPPPAGGATGGAIEGFSIVEIDTGGAVVWRLTADRADETEEEVKVEAIRLEFPGPDSPTVLTGPRGRLDRSTRDVVLEGGVVIDLADGGRVESERVEWRADRRRIFAPAPVRFEHAGSWAEADEVEVDPRTRTLWSRNARGQVNLEP